MSSGGLISKVKMRAQIQAEEDQRVLDILEGLVSRCRNKDHNGCGKPIIECDHPDCIVQSVVES